MMKLNKLCSNLDQSNPNSGGFTDEEKDTMRNNIGAADASALNRLSSSVQDLSHKVAADDGEITEIKSLFAPEVATATVNYTDI